MHTRITLSPFCSTIKCWDLAAGKCSVTLTNHKKGVRSVLLHPSEFTFGSASADNLKKWQLPQGNFLQNLSGHNTIVNCMALNADNVLVSGGLYITLCTHHTHILTNLQAITAVFISGTGRQAITSNRC